MRPNLGGEGRDPRQLGQCSNFNRIWVLKASLNNNYLFCLYFFFCELKYITIFSLVWRPGSFSAAPKKKSIMYQHVQRFDISHPSFHKIQSKIHICYNNFVCTQSQVQQNNWQKYSKVQSEKKLTGSYLKNSVFFCSLYNQSHVLSIATLLELIVPCKLSF